MGLVLSDTLIHDTWKYKTLKGNSKEFNWSYFRSGITNAKMFSNVGSIRGVTIPYSVVTPDGNGLSTRSVGGVNLSAPESATKAILEAHSKGMIEEYNILKGSLGGDDPSNSLEVIKNITTDFESIAHSAIDEAVILASKAKQKTSLRATQAGKDGTEKGYLAARDDIVEYFDEIIDSLEKLNKSIGSNLQHGGGLKLDKGGVIEGLRDSRNKLSITSYNSIGVNRNGVKKVTGSLSGAMSNRAGALLEEALAYKIRNTLNGFEDGVRSSVEVKGSQKYSFDYGGETYSFPQGKTDIEINLDTSRIGISAKNYQQKELKTKSISLHTGDIKKLLQISRWDNSLMLLSAYGIKNSGARSRGDSSKMKDIISATIASMAIAGTPGDRVHIIAYADKMIPVYSYMTDYGLSLSGQKIKPNTYKDLKELITVSKHNVQISNIESFTANISAKKKVV